MLVAEKGRIFSHRDEELVTEDSGFEALAIREDFGCNETLAAITWSN